MRVKTPYTGYKTALTKAKKALDRAVERPDKLKAAEALINVCDNALRDFETIGFPDQWHDWERAKDDALFLIQRLQRPAF